MRIFVDGKEAYLQSSASFEYVSENPLFTDAEGYSLDITFPLRGCATNIAIFGALHVQGVDISSVTYSCEIRDALFRKTGILTILSVSDKEVKGQFLEGMSRENYASSIPDVYLTDLDFSAFDGSDGTSVSMNRVNGEGWGRLVVWDSNKEQPVYAVRSVPGGDAMYHTHIYLYHLVELVGEVCHIKIDTSTLDGIEIYRKAIVCNTMDWYAGSYPPLNRVLPHWTVKEFFRQIGNFFGCMVKVDESTQSVFFMPCRVMLSTSSESVHAIQPLDSFSVELQDSDNTYRGNVGFKLPDACDPNHIHMCSWLMAKNYLYNLKNRDKSSFHYIISHAFSGIRDGLDEMYNSDNTLYYLTDIQRYAVITERADVYINNSQELGELPDHIYAMFDIINQYGDFTEGEELGIAPCPIEVKGMWVLPTIDCEYDNETVAGAHTMPYKMPVIEMIRDREIDNINNEGPTTPVLDILSAGEEKETEYYDKLWLVLHSGVMDINGNHINTRQYEAIAIVGYNYDVVQKYEGEMPFLTTDWQEYPNTLSPIDAGIQENARLPKVDESRLYRFQFLSKFLPSASDIYLIRGRKYACIRLTAHFSPMGMSELIEGEFYRIVD